jgi:diguanylate cyclase (GGDEF)-like protein
VSGGEAASDLSAVMAGLDCDLTLERWRELCSSDRILSGGDEISVRVETLDAFLDALREPYGFEEHIDALSSAAEDLLAHAGAGGLATRQLLALAEALSQFEEPERAGLRAEFDRRLRVVLGRFVLYVNLAALKDVDRQARRDALTGLHNRLAFDLETQRLHKKGVAFCVAMIDVDGLKRVNDSRGHEAGDDLLRRVATALAESCAGGEYAYRFGGDEYAFVSTVRSSPEVDELLAGLSADQTPFSWGVAHHPDDEEGLEKVVDLADKRMYSRKRARKRATKGEVPLWQWLQRVWRFFRDLR